jgi:hypothetical protein
MNASRPASLSLALALFAAACGGDDPTSLSPPQREIKAQPSFANDINEIFQRRGCSSGACHGAAGGQAGLVLSAGASANYAMLVNVQATSENFLRVAPSDADNSYLVIKLEGRQTVGQRMPRGAAPLDDIDMTNIRKWIDNGAPRN